MGADNMTDRERIQQEFQPDAYDGGVDAADGRNFGRVTANGIREEDAPDDVLEEVVISDSDVEPVRIPPASPSRRRSWEERGEAAEEAEVPPNEVECGATVPDPAAAEEYTAIGPAAGSVAMFVAVDVEAPPEVVEDTEPPRGQAAEPPKFSDTAPEPGDAAHEDTDHELEAARQSAPPEAPRVVAHEEIDDFTVEVIQNGGKIPENLQVDPDDLAVVRTAVALVRDNLARLVPSARQTRSEVIRDMASDQQITRCAENGVGWAVAVVMQRSMELLAEDPRAKLARQAAYEVADGGDVADTSGAARLQDIASMVLNKWYGDKYMGNPGLRMAPYLAAYAIEQAGSRYQDNPELVAATVLGFEHSCEVTGFRVKDFPPSFQNLRLSIRDTLTNAVDTVRTELGRAGKLIYDPAERVRALVTIGCSSIAHTHWRREAAERYRALEAARRAEEAEHARQEAIREAAAAKERALYDANVTSSLRYNYRVALTPKALASDAIATLSSGQIGRHILDIAALFEQADAQLPGADVALGQVKRWLDQGATGAVVSYMQGIRAKLIEGDVPPEVAVVVDAISPGSVADPAIRDQMQDLRRVVNYAATQHFANGRISWTPPAVRLARTGFIVGRRQAASRAALDRLREAGQTGDAGRLQQVHDGRLLRFLRTSEELDADNLQIPDKLRALVDEARAYQQRLEAEQEAARAEAPARTPWRRVMAAVVGYNRGGA